MSCFRRLHECATYIYTATMARATLVIVYMLWANTEGDGNMLVLVEVQEA